MNINSESIDAFSNTPQEKRHNQFEFKIGEEDCDVSFSARAPLIYKTALDFAQTEKYMVTLPPHLEKYQHNPYLISLLDTLVSISSKFNELKSETIDLIVHSSDKNLRESVLLDLDDITYFMRRGTVRDFASLDEGLVEAIEQTTFNINGVFDMVVADDRIYTDDMGLASPKKERQPQITWENCPSLWVASFFGVGKDLLKQMSMSIHQLGMLPKVKFAFRRDDSGTIIQSIGFMNYQFGTDDYNRYQSFLHQSANELLHENTAVIPLVQGSDDDLESILHPYCQVP